MANFGFRRLAVVAPYAPHWREARSAVGAPEVLQNAKSTECLADAVAGCTLVAGTGTVTRRKPEQAVVSLPDLAPVVDRELARGGRVAVVFGPEKHGLTREDLSYCHMLVEIPTDPRQPSMNLGQAVAVCLYELARRAFLPGTGAAGVGDEQAAGTARAPSKKTEKHASGAKAHTDNAAHTARQKSCPDTEINNSAASKAMICHPVPFTATGVTTAPCGELELLAGVVEETMTAAGYSPRSMQPANRHDLRLLLRRLALTRRDARRILGLFRRILWRFNH